MKIHKNAMIVRTLASVIAWGTVFADAESTTLNPVAVANDDELIVSTLHEDNLVYKRIDQSTNSAELWTYDSVTQSASQLTLVDENGENIDVYRTADDFASYQGKLYYYRIFDDGPTQMYYTTLDSEGGMVPNQGGLVFSAPFFVKNGMLFALSVESGNDPNGFFLRYRLISVNNDELTEYSTPLYTPFVYIPPLYDPPASPQPRDSSPDSLLRAAAQRQFCAFSYENIIALTENPDRSVSLSQVTYGESTRLMDFTSPPSIYGMVQSGDSCILQVVANSGEYALYRISESGELAALSDVQPTSEANIRHVFEMNGRVYALGSRQADEQNFFPVDTFKRLSPDFQSFDAEYDVESTFNGLFEESVTYAGSVGNVIFYRKYVDSDGPTARVGFLDQNLNPLASPSNIDDGLATTVYAYPTSDSSVLVYSQGSGQSDMALFAGDPSNSVRLRDPDFAFQNVVSAPDSSQAYLQAFDRRTQSQALLAFEDVPHIHNQTTGAWNDPSLQSQGVSIHKGSRNDGTEYLFITLYLYRDGNPLWLAGSEDLVIPTRTLTIDLFEFGGADLFEPGVTPVRQSFGSINLEFTGCNELRAEVTHGSGNAALGLTRIDNVEFADVCVE